MFKPIMIAAATIAAMSSGVAIAKETQPSSTEVSATASPKTRYCIKSQPVTGTMLQAQSCKTLEQWKALGIDPTQKKR